MFALRPMIRRWVRGTVEDTLRAKIDGLTQSLNWALSQAWPFLSKSAQAKKCGTQQKSCQLNRSGS